MEGTEYLDQSELQLRYGVRDTQVRRSFAQEAFLGGTLRRHGIGEVNDGFKGDVTGDYDEDQLEWGNLKTLADLAAFYTFEERAMQTMAARTATSECPRVPFAAIAA